MQPVPAVKPSAVPWPATSASVTSTRRSLRWLRRRKVGLDAAVVADAERRKSFLARLLAGLAEPAMMDTSVAMLTPEAVTMRSDHVRAVIVEAIREVAERGRVVIVSHAASIPLAGRRDVLRVLVTASEETRAQRVARDSLSGTADPTRFVRDNDASRAHYFQRCYRIERELPTTATWSSTRTR
jgi:hypothetical protein